MRHELTAVLVVLSATLLPSGVLGQETATTHEPGRVLGGDLVVAGGAVLWADDALVGTDLNYETPSGIGGNVFVGFNVELTPFLRMGVHGGAHWLSGSSEGYSINLIFEADIVEFRDGKSRVYLALGPGVYRFDNIPAPRFYQATPGGPVSTDLAMISVGGSGMFLGMGLSHRLHDDVVAFVDAGVHGISRGDDGIEPFVPVRVGFRFF